MPRRPLSNQTIAVNATVQVQIQLDHHQFPGPLHTIDQACSNKPVLASHWPTVLGELYTAKSWYDH